MPTGLLILAMLIFGLAFWLGLYLISRDVRNPRLCFAGLGLVCYALAVTCEILSQYGSTSAPVLHIAHLSWLALTLFALLTAGTLTYFLPEEASYKAVKIMNRITTIRLFTLVLFVPGMALLLLSSNDLLHDWILVFAGLDLVLFGLTVATVDAINRGEALLPDIFRSFDYSLAISLLFGGQVTLFIIVATGTTFFMLALLMTTIATSIATQVFSDQVVGFLDKVAFSYFPRLQKARADLRTTASTLPRINQDLDLEQMDDAEFTRLTRRALSNFGDLARLATSPLANLPIVEARLTAHGRKIDTLERANELKALLTESILRLKPRGNDEFGTSDEWRYYNALYFPYIVGLKPYTRRTPYQPGDPVARKALDWFRTQIPERTLYNWQNAATKLVAQELRSCKN